jgi:hypothetical protein
MAKSFSAQVDEYIAKYKNRLIAVARDATQEVINQSNRPVAKGGRMRVDTGFLRASGQASLTGMPQGPIRGNKDATYNTDEATIILSLSQLQLGGSFFFGWSANYAKYRELYDGFLSSTIANWQSIVDKSVLKAKEKFK